MTIWSYDLGWFVLGTCLILALVIISIERISYNAKKAETAMDVLDNSNKEG